LAFVRALFDTPTDELAKSERGLIATSGSTYFSMAPNWAIGSEKIMLLCIAGGHNLNAALAQPERIAPPTNPTILVMA